MSAPAGEHRRTIRTNGIELSAVERGDGPLVVLCHGFPELSYSWRHQIPVLADAGYHVVAPDMRGYGLSDAPAGVEGYDIVNLTDDMAGLVEALGEERAVFVGHDWGAVVVWSLAILHPEKVLAVAGLSVPFLPRPSHPPTETLRFLFGGNFMYILYFQRIGPADEELSRDPRRTIARFLWSASGDRPQGFFAPRDHHGVGVLDTLSDPPATLPAWLTEHDIDRYAGEFARTGFSGPLSYYRNLDRNWQLMEPFAEARVTQPALFLAGERDPVIRMSPPSVMDGWVEDLRASVVVPGAGHWIQHERPEETNDALRSFLAQLV